MTFDFRGCETIFSGNDVRVLLSDRGIDKIVISFSNRGRHTSGDPRYGARLFDKLGVSAIFYIALADHWWQSPEMDASIHIVNKITEKYSDRITYGQSMGGFGAVLFARKLSSRYIVSSPQICIDASIAPLRQSWIRDISRNEILYPSAADGARGVSGMIIYDPADTIDNWHAERLFRSEGFHSRFIVPFVGHHLPKALNEMGLMSSLAAMAIMGNLHCGEFRQLVRASRLKSQSYLLKLANKIKIRRRHWLTSILYRYVMRNASNLYSLSQYIHISTFLNDPPTDIIKRYDVTRGTSYIPYNRIVGFLHVKVKQQLSEIVGVDSAYLSTGYDPQFLAQPSTPWIQIVALRVEMYSSVDSVAVLYWSRNNSSSFCEANSIKLPVIIGLNILKFDLSSVGARGVVRFDPVARRAAIRINLITADIVDCSGDAIGLR